MRHILLATFALAALCSTASAAVKVGAVHQPQQHRPFELWDSYLETLHPSGGRILVRVQSGEEGLVRWHLAADGSDLTDPVVLVQNVREYSVSVHLTDEGTLLAGWFDRDLCQAGVATFDLDGKEKRRRVHALDPEWCELYAYLVRGIDGDWHLFQHLQIPGVSGYRTLSFDWNTVEQTREVIPSGPDSDDLDISPDLAVGEDGSIATIGAHGNFPYSLYGRVWDAEGRAITGRIELGTIAGQIEGVRAIALTQGRFLMAWKADVASGQWVAREIVVGPGQPSTTTTTTLPPPEDVPELSHVTKIHVLEEGWQRHSRLATDGDGTWVAAWNDSARARGDSAFVAVSGNNGRTWSGAQLLGEGSDVVVAADEDGQWLAGAFDCAFDDPAECLWRFWRSRDGGRTWTSNYGPYEDRWIDYLPRPYFDDFLYDAPRLLSEGDGRWVFAVTARQDVDQYWPGNTVVFVARSDDDGAHWRWVPGALDEYYGDPFVTAPGLVPVSSGSMVLWKLDSFYGAATADLHFDHVQDGRMLSPDWTEPLLARLYPAGFNAAADGEQTVVAAWSSRSAEPQGSGFDADVVFSRSEDGGEQWTHPQPICGFAQSDGAADDLPHIATNRRGGWLAGWRSTWLSRDEEHPVVDALASYSGDDGRTWSSPFALAPAQVKSADEYVLSALEGTRRGGSGSFGALWTTTFDEAPSALWVSMTKPAGICGDGAVSRDEDCDDGNASDGDGCDSNCTQTGCGNGVVSGAEECDDGNLSSEDACTHDCRTAFCGDGNLRWDTELCDDANDDPTDACKPDCYPAACGDGVRATHEECDDENGYDGDGCDSNCTITGCGNGRVTAGESCDDGNADENDDCLSTCTVARCGDGVVHARNPPCTHRRCPDPLPLEECDDGNSIDGDGCSADCKLPVCGDGVAFPGVEECDDGNRRSGDGCDFDCSLTRCGNGVWTSGEECDDGNTADGDSCSSDCSDLVDGCGDADASGDVSSSDAQRVLHMAVDMPVDCPRWTCDANGSGTVTAVDGSLVLRKAVGLQVTTDCSDRIIVRMTSSSLVGALQLEIDHHRSAGTFHETADKIRCKRLVPALAAFSDHDGILGMGFVSLEGFQGPVDLAECTFRRFAPPVGNEFAVSIGDASGPDFEAPRVRVRVVVMVE